MNWVQLLMSLLPILADIVKQVQTPAKQFGMSVAEIDRVNPAVKEITGKLEVVLAQMKAKGVK